MNTKRISAEATALIEHYQHITVGPVRVPVPYFNNRTTGQSRDTRAAVGKGHPRDIEQEAAARAREQKISLAACDTTMARTFLLKNNLGIDCSGFAFHVLNQENHVRGFGDLEKHIPFFALRGLRGFIAGWLFPAQNVGVRAFADERVSAPVSLTEAAPGDIITMRGDETSPQNQQEPRDHMMLIEQVEYQNFAATTLHYCHAIRWNSDTALEHGVQRGTIRIIKPTGTLLEQEWHEQHSSQGVNESLTRAQARAAKLSLRRLLWWPKS
jgi:hypothetical protein